MALVKCPECGRENVSDTAEVCPNCGFAIRDYFSKEAEESGVPVQPEESSNNEPSDKRRNKKSTSYYCTYCGTQVDDIPICSNCKFSTARSYKRFCRYCGNEVNGKKCDKCGLPIDGSTAENVMRVIIRVIFIAYYIICSNAVLVSDTVSMLLVSLFSLVIAILVDVFVFRKKSIRRIKSRFAGTDKVVLKLSAIYAGIIIVLAVTPMLLNAIMPTFKSTAPSGSSTAASTETVCKEHDFSPATCTKPATCKNCGETQGVALGHTPSEWQADTPNYGSGCVWMRKRCTVCGTELDSKLLTIPLHEDGELLLSLREFTERYGRIFKYTDPDFETTFFSPDKDSSGCMIVKDGTEHIGTALFLNKDEEIISDGDAYGIVRIMIAFNTSDMSDVAASAVAAILAVDPSLEFEDAQEVCSDALGKEYTYNGISYHLVIYQGDVLMSIEFE